MNGDRCVTCGQHEPQGYHGAWCWHDKQARQERAQTRSRERTRYGPPLALAGEPEPAVKRSRDGWMVRCPNGCWSEASEAQARGDEPVACWYCDWSGKVAA